MAQWGSTSESGILRKNKPKENLEDLLVFGYACKLFRDDEKALYIDNGKHLIPWMGDEKLKIDRYDGRGTLSDLRPLEASREGYDATRWLGLNESDRKIEQLCDKERYYSLKNNEEEEEMYKEEERKRLKATEFQYSYDVPADPALETAPTVPEQEEEDAEYVPPPNLDVPVDIAMPKTVKESARIEKTALFVCKQGLQMEILIKAKQANNPQFGFLNQGHELYKFYRHVLSAIKNGRYQPEIGRENEEKSEENVENSASDESYLHPSLISVSTTQPKTASNVVIPPAIPYKPSANCAYTQLVTRIQGGQGGGAPLPPNSDVNHPPNEKLTPEQQQYYQYYYAAQYYEYYKQMAIYQQQGGQNGQERPPDMQNLDANAQAYIQQMAWNQYLSNHQQSQNTTNPYAQIVSNVNKDVQNPYSGLITARHDPKSTDETPKKIDTNDIKPAKNDQKVGVLPLADYGSDSEEDEDEEEKEEESYPIPAGDTKVVIDKMAVYVAKNGEQFEEIVKAKGDPRFEFLNASHAFNPYYRAKIAGLKETKTVTIVRKKRPIAPVCFSIKKAPNRDEKEIKSALPVEESSEEEEAEAAVEEKAAEEAPPAVEEQKEEAAVGLDADDPILEMIDLTDEKKDVKRAEERIRDKLAAAAREKMASVARDRALQLERKRKAAAFLKLKSEECGNSGGGGVGVKEEQQRKKVKKAKKSSHKRKRSKSKRSDSRGRKRSKRKRKRSNSDCSTDSKSSS